MTRELRHTLLAASVNGAVIAALLGACVLAGFDAVDDNDRHRWEEANVSRARMLADLAALRQEWATLKSRDNPEPSR